MNHLSESKKALKKYGKKILQDPADDWTNDEIVAHFLYKLYSIENITPSVILKFREELIENYGNKIADFNRPTDGWVRQEIIARNFYKQSSELLHELDPEIISLDKQYEFLLKNDIDGFTGWLKYSYKIIKKTYIPILAFLILLALLKFIL